MFGVKIVHALIFEMQQTNSQLNQNPKTCPDLSKITLVCCDMLCAALMNDSSRNSKHTPFPCVWWSSDTGQWPQSRSSWCSHEDWIGQNRRSLLDRYHTWHQQHFSANMAEITERKSEQGKTKKMSVWVFKGAVWWNELTLQRHCPVSGWHTSGVTPPSLQLQGTQSGKR